MVWKTSAANWHDHIPGLCVNSVHRPNSTEHFALSVDVLINDARFSTSEIYYEDIKFYSAFNLII
jgi:hypothetical protein